MRQYNINGMCVYVRPVKRDVEEDVDDDSLKSRSRKKPWLSVSEKDTVLALATVENGVPHVRNVNAYYENGAFYIITYALSGKMRHIESNPGLPSPVSGLQAMVRGSIWDIGEKKRIIRLPKR